MVVNLLGNPNDFLSINQIINGRNIVLIEDNCESMGASLDGGIHGTFGVMGTFSVSTPIIFPQWKEVSY